MFLGYFYTFFPFINKKKLHSSGTPIETFCNYFFGHISGGRLHIVKWDNVPLNIISNFNFVSIIYSGEYGGLIKYLKLI